MTPFLCGMYTPESSSQTLDGHTYWINSVAFSPDGTLPTASGSDDDSRSFVGFAYRYTHANANGSYT